jgi:hypothetical protein
LLVFGFGAMNLKSLISPLDSKNISISITYPGASPRSRRRHTKIEDNLKGLNGRTLHQHLMTEKPWKINVEIEKKVERYRSLYS